MTKIGAYTPETSRMILDVVKYLVDSGFVITRPGRGKQNHLPQESPIYIRNDSGEEMPPFACMQVTGTVEAGGQNYVKVDKPVDTSGTAGEYLFNGFAAVEDGGYGIAYAGPFVRVLTDGSTITCGDSWQPVVNQWYITTGGSLLSAVGADDIETDVMRAFILGGSGGFTRIEFEVTAATTVSDTNSPFDGMRKLTVTVVSPSCNEPGLHNEEVDVYEHEPLCLTGDETDLALVGRKGWAFKGVHQDMSAGASVGDLTPCHFVLDGLCCP